MSTTILNVRVDKKDKYKADQIVKDLGLTLSSAVNSFIKAIIRNNGIPYNLRNEVPNKETIKAIKEAKKLGHSKKAKIYNNFDELRQELGV